MPAFSAVVRWSICIAGIVSFLSSIFLLRALEEENVNAVESFIQHRLAEDHNASVPDGTSTRAETAVWPHPFIHIVNTRFMQHQSDLVDLARARLVLFETFCLNSILGQSVLRKVGKDTPPFLWIIKMDPDLDVSIVKDLLSLIEPYPFIYLVASNVNYGIGVVRGGWRGSEAGEDVLRSHVYSGNMTLLRQAHASREERAILETRLDADDGLHVRLLEVIQLEAWERLRYDRSITQERQRWIYWCHRNHLDWTPSLPFSYNESEYGMFVPYRTTHHCITAGITVGVSVGQEEKNVPRFMHHKLYQELYTNNTQNACGGTNCLRMLQTPVLGVIRSRTATSAGMRGVRMEADKDDEYAVAVSDKHLMKSLEDGFHILISKIAQVNKYMQDNMYPIAADNLRGQCTHGHSCKNSTRETLQELLLLSKNYTDISMGLHQ